MIKIATILAASTVLALVGGPAFADGVTKTWVSSTTGSDAGTCQFTAPCKTFAYAITQTLPGGELDVKDAGSYGPMTITHAISIVNQGFLAQISVPSGGVGVVVSAGANDKVILQGLVIDGHGVGSDGIDFNSGAILTIEDFHVRNLTTNGISLQQNSGQNYHISRTEVAYIYGTGITISPSSGAARGEMDHIDIHDNRTGINAELSTFSLVDSVLSGNYFGIELYTQGIAYMSRTTIIGSSSGVSLESGILYSYGDNDINGNTMDIAGGSITVVAKR